jgi:hypothetical protein
MSDAPAPEQPAVPTFPPDARVCGNCKLWTAHSVDARGWVGPCRVQPNRGLFPPSAPICDAFVARGSVTVVVTRSETPQRSRPLRNIAPTVIKRRPDPSTPVDVGGELDMTRDELMEIFREASGEVDVPLASKWEGGTLTLKPGRAELQGKDLPIDTFFHKVVMVRDRLRTLEQKINGHPKLTDAEKVEMQQYITRVYGSLTSFNVLFREKNDQFIGAKGDES